MNAALEAAATMIAVRHHVPIADLLGRSRAQTIQRARNDLYVTLRHSCGFSFSEIGAMLGRHHSTVISAVHTREAELAALYPPRPTLAELAARDRDFPQPIRPQAELAAMYPVTP